MTTRRNDTLSNGKPQTWFRSDRVFCADGAWYFHTREGVDVGPYRNKFEAEVDAEMLKTLLVGIDQAEARRVIRKFMLDEGTTIDDLKGEFFTDYLVKEGINAIQGAAS